MTKKQMLPLALILVIASLLTPFAQTFMRDQIVAPLLYGYWIGRIVFESIPQDIVWGVFAVIILLLTLFSLIRQPKPTKPQTVFITAKQPQIEQWAKLIRQADGEHYYKWQLAQQFQKLTLEAIAQQERRPVKQIRQQLNNQEIDLPSDIQAYLKASSTSFGHFAVKRRFFSRQHNEPSPLDLDPEAMVLFLENRFLGEQDKGEVIDDLK
ncbi:MAG: hypothetical protein AAF485_01845 [Chloroflexota bacterium]